MSVKPEEAHCETVAVAIQVVLASTDTTVVAPLNQAVAYNYQCNACATFASAYQDLVMMDGAVHFTSTGNRDLAMLRRELEHVRHEQLTFTQLQAEVKSVEQQVAQVVATQLVVGRSPGPGQAEQPPAAQPDAGTPSSSTPTTGATSPSSTNTTSPSSTTSTTTPGTTSSSTSTTTTDNGAGTTTTSSTTSTTAP